MMDFALSGEQTALVDSVARFVQREYVFEARGEIIRSAQGFSTAHWAAFAELGWLGAGLSEAQGGFGGSVIDYALIAEQLGKGLVVEPFVPVVQALVALAGAPDFEGRAALIESMIMGETRIVVVEGDVHVGGDVHGEGDTLTGAARLVVGGPSADAYLVAAGAALYLVPHDAEGLTRHDYRLLDNTRASDLMFSAVKADKLSDNATSARANARDHALILLCAEAVGAMETALWITRDYLKTRQQFGRAIGEFQGLQFRMADMLVECELARSMLYQGLAAIGAPDQSQRVAAAKAMISEAGLFVGQQAIQLHGGIGMTEECNIGHYYKKLFVIAHLFGAPDAHIARFAAA